MRRNFFERVLHFVHTCIIIGFHEYLWTFLTKPGYFSNGNGRTSTLHHFSTCTANIKKRKEKERKSHANFIGTVYGCKMYYMIYSIYSYVWKKFTINYGRVHRTSWWLRASFSLPSFEGAHPSSCRQPERCDRETAQTAGRRIAGRQTDIDGQTDIKHV